MRNAECPWRFEGRTTLHCNSAFRIPHSALERGGRRAGDGPDNRRRVQGSSFEGARGGRGPADRGPRARSVVLHPPTAVAWGARPRSVRGLGRAGPRSALARRRERGLRGDSPARGLRSEEHTSELQSLAYLVCRLLLEKK